MSDAHDHPPTVPTDARTPMAVRHHGNDLGAGGAARETAIRVLNYATNHVVNHLPSHAVRHAWYRRVLGIRLDPTATVHLGCYVWSYGPGNLRRRDVRIGARSLVNRDCTLDMRDAIAIGADVSISPGVVILTTQHDIEHPDFVLESRPVVVEDHAFIGMRAMLMPGVRIGRGAVVAAGAVVTRDVAAMEIVAGVPARVVGRRRLDPGYRLEDTRPLLE